MSMSHINLITKLKKKPLLPALIIIALAFFVYVNTLFNDFAWDDIMVFSKNPEVMSPLFSAFSRIDNLYGSDYTPYYRPLTMLSYMIEQRLHQLNPALMHLLNTLLHCANSLLFYFLARTLTSCTLTPLIAALLFAVHPISSESVAFLAGGRNTLLATFFTLSTYLLHCESIVGKSLRYSLLAAICFLAGLFSKELIFGIIPFILYLEAPAFKQRDTETRIRAIFRLLPYLFTLVAYFWLRSNALSGVGEPSAVLPELLSRLANNFYILPRYLLTLLWPLASNAHYSLPDSLNNYILPLVFAWAGILLSVWWLLTKGKNSVAVFGLSWFLIFWLPTSGIIPFPSAVMADRYLYIPVFGLWLIAAHQTVQFIENMGERLYRPLMIVFIVLLVLLCATSVMRNRVWKNDVTLFSDFVRKNPELAIGHHNLGTAYLDVLNDLEHAEYEFMRALEINPKSPRTHTQLGYINILRGNDGVALLHYDAALMLDPYDAEAILNRGMALDRMGLYGEAYTAYKLFLEIPDRRMSKARYKTEIRLKELEKIIVVHQNKL